MISILISRMMSIFIKLYSDLLYFVRRSHFWSITFSSSPKRMWSLTEPGSCSTRQYFRFRISDDWHPLRSHSVQYCSEYSCAAALFCKYPAPLQYGHGSGFGVFLIVVFHQSFPCLIIWRWCRTSQGTAVFPGTSVGSVLPLILWGMWKLYCI